MNGKIYFHHIVKDGHLNSNIKANTKACFEIEEAGEVISTGSTAANTTVIYKSVIVFGNLNEILDSACKTEVLEGFMHKYALHLPDRPLTKKAVDNITIYSMSIENITGKERQPDTP
jgi:nitroimidazol reductase NimA-like FMN-containing flavoprotein (pyridoxamine 5'-phosphate oxidase superfamily)